MSLQAVFHDKYAAFIWPAYGATLLVFIWMLLDTLARARRWRRRAQELEKEERP